MCFKYENYKPYPTNIFSFAVPDGSIEQVKSGGGARRK